MKTSQMNTEQGGVVSRRRFLGLLPALVAAVTQAPKIVAAASVKPAAAVVAAPLVETVTANGVTIPFWLETTRMAMCRSELYDKFHQELIKNNPHTFA